MEAPPLQFTQKEFEAFRLGMAQKRPVHLITCFDGENSIQVERHYPLTPEDYLAPDGPPMTPERPLLGKSCKHCKHPEPRWYKMGEKLYGPKAFLCGNCEQLSYLKG